MNQSNKRILEFIKNSGVNYFLQDTPRNWLKKSKNLLSTSSKNLNNDKFVKIQQIIEKIKSFDSSLKESAKNLVVYDGSLDAKVMFIGEAPGRDEDIEGLPFVGRAGQLLNKMLAAINLKREDVYITNVVNWRPPDNRTPTDEEILEYLPFVQEQIDVVNPDYIFLLGGVATKAILSTPLALGKLRGAWHKYQSLKLNKTIYTIVSYHPAFLLRSPQFKKASWEDLKMLQKKLNEKN
tara:strand:- start:983 stop:1693 length:711 start_codon:yes stop_codon:yes gene_type:complete